jgi:hypothetical protein
MVELDHSAAANVDEAIADGSFRESAWLCETARDIGKTVESRCHEMG